MFKIFAIISTIVFVSAVPKTEVRKNILVTGVVNECDGKDAGNYTYHATYTIGEDCSPGSSSTSDDTTLTLIGPNGQRLVNNMKILADSNYAAGADYQNEILFLALSGNLEGKYVYKKMIRTATEYLKKCSSVLGYSYVSSKSLSFLISDKLDINVLISPTGGYEVFKRGCTTVCSGVEYVL